MSPKRPRRSRKGPAIPEVVARLTSEAVKAQDELTALATIYKARASAQGGLLSVCHGALYQSTVARTICIYDKYPGAAGVWHLFDVCPQAVPHFVKHGLTKPKLSDLSKKLMIIRNTSHMHFDKRYINDPRRPWAGSGLALQEQFTDFVSRTASALRDLYGEVHGRPFAALPYSASDVPLMLNALRAVGLIK